MSSDNDFVDDLKILSDRGYKVVVITDGISDSDKYLTRFASHRSYIWRDVVDWVTSLSERDIGIAGTSRTDSLDGETDLTSHGGTTSTRSTKNTKGSEKARKRGRKKKSKTTIEEDDDEEAISSTATKSPPKKKKLKFGKVALLQSVKSKLLF